jgi:hypothetical protein
MMIARIGKGRRMTDQVIDKTLGSRRPSIHRTTDVTLPMSFASHISSRDEGFEDLQSGGWPAEDDIELGNCPANVHEAHMTHEYEEGHCREGNTSEVKFEQEL